MFVLDLYSSFSELEEELGGFVERYEALENSKDDYLSKFQSALDTVSAKLLTYANSI